MDNFALIVFRNRVTNEQVDLEIPLDIAARDLVYAFNAAFNLNIDVADTEQCYLQAENPIVLLRGDKKLADFGIRHGSIIFFNPRRGKDNR